jgi:hypothetical protein
VCSVPSSTGTVCPDTITPFNMSRKGVTRAVTLPDGPGDFTVDWEHS